MNEEKVTKAVTIPLKEYKELTFKAWAFDVLKEQAKKASYLTEFERAVFELPEIKEETDNVDS